MRRTLVYRNAKYEIMNTYGVSRVEENYDMKLEFGWFEECRAEKDFWL